MAFFNRDNAKDFARKANLVRWSKPRPKDLPKRSKPLPSLPIPAICLPIAEETWKQIQQLDFHISRLTARASIDPEQVELLTRAKERLWKVLSHAADIPLPGVKKPAKARPALLVDITPDYPAEVNHQPAADTDVLPAADTDGPTALAAG